MITASVVVATEAGDCEYSLKLQHDPEDDRLVTDEAVWRMLPTQKPVDTALAEKILQRLNGHYGGFREDCFVFHFRSSAAGANANKRWNIGNSACLGPDGGNLAPVLLAIRQNDLRRYHYIVRQIQRVVPDFVLKDEYSKVLLRWKHRCSDQVIEPYLTADGMLRLFFLITLLNLPEDRWPTLLMIDEPETGLHPQAAELLAAMIRRISDERQVLVATQSPILVDAAGSEDVIIASASRGAAQFERVHPEVYQRWQEGGYTVSDLWLSCPIGGHL